MLPLEKNSWINHSIYSQDPGWQKKKKSFIRPLLNQGGRKILGYFITIFYQLNKKMIDEKSRPPFLTWKSLFEIVIIPLFQITTNVPWCSIDILKWNWLFYIERGIDKRIEGPRLERFVAFAIQSAVQPVIIIVLSPYAHIIFLFFRVNITTLICQYVHNLLHEILTKRCSLSYIIIILMLIFLFI